MVLESFKNSATIDTSGPHQILPDRLMQRRETANQAGRVFLVVVQYVMVPFPLNCGYTVQGVIVQYIANWASNQGSQV